jgi:TonB family protein
MCGCAESSGSTRSGGTTAEEQRTAQNANDAAAHDPERHDATDRMFTRKAIDLQNCWQDEYDRTKNRKWETDMTLQVMVSASGKASDVKVLKTSNPNAQVEQCVQKLVGNWNFPEGTSTMPYVRSVHLGAQF